MATIHLEPSTRAISLAGACLKAMINDHDVNLQDCYMHQSPDDIGDSILTFSPDVVGFTVYLWNRDLTIRAIKYIKKINPDITVLAGGPEITADPESFLFNSFCDIAMEGEGEATIAEILDRLNTKQNLSGLPGVWTKGIKPGKAAYCADFNSLPSPILKGSLDLSRNPGLLWELSRGCPFACDFCFESKGTGSIRAISLERIEAELALIRDNGIEQVFVLDPTFNSHKKRVLSILELIRKYTPYTYYYFEARSEFLDEETAQAFASIPCTLQIGLQSSSLSVLKKVNRTLDRVDFREKMEMLSRYGVSYGLDLIYGLPGDSLESYKESLNYALSLEPNHLDIFPLAVLPGTVLYDKAEILGLEFRREDPYTVLGSRELSSEDLEEAGKIACSADELYNSGKAVSWFMRSCGELKRNPVDLTEAWREFRHDRKIPEEELQEEIIRFLESLYLEANLPDEFRVIRDVITLIQFQEELEDQSETIESPSEGIILDEDTRIVLEPSVKLERFAVPPYTLMQGMESDPSSLIHYLNREDENWILFSRSWEICSEKLDDKQYALVSRLKTPCQIKELSDSGMEDGCLKEFLLESVLEGYVKIL